MKIKYEYDLNDESVRVVHLYAEDDDDRMLLKRWRGPFLVCKEPADEENGEHAELAHVTIAEATGHAKGRGSLG
jgi:hypothetical protein